MVTKNSRFVFLLLLVALTAHFCKAIKDLRMETSNEQHGMNNFFFWIQTIAKDRGDSVFKMAANNDEATRMSKEQEKISKMYGTKNIASNDEYIEMQDDKKIGYDDTVFENKKLYSARNHWFTTRRPHV